MTKQLGIAASSAPIPSAENPFADALTRFAKRAAKRAARTGLEEFGMFIQTPEAKPIKDSLQMAHIASGGVLKVALQQLDQALDPDVEEPKRK